MSYAVTERKIKINIVRYFRHFTTQREKLENRRQFLKMTAKMKINQALDGYLDWISKAGLYIMNPNCIVHIM